MNLAYIKTAISHDISMLGYQRPLMGSKDWVDNSIALKSPFDLKKLRNYKLLPLSNLLQIPNLEKRNSLSKLSYYLYITTSKRHLKYPNESDIKKTTLSNDRVLDAIQQIVTSEKIENQDKLRAGLKEKASNMLNEMFATVTSSCIRFCGWLFLTLLRQLCASVAVHQGQLEIIKEILKREQAVILLPLHYSHFDYILLSLLMYTNQMKAPFVATGNNLNLPIFSYVMKRVGGFFIKRKIDKGKEKDLLYRSVLHSYVTELLKSSQLLEVYIEGTRSRGGTPNSPKTGILSIVVDAINEVSDIVVVPVCISYEKLIDGPFQSELMGNKKEPETFFRTIRTTISILRGYYGHIRVNFGRPRSLKDTILELKNCPNLPFKDGILEQEVELKELSGPEQSFEAVNTSLVPQNPTGNKFDANRVLVSLLAEHLVYRSLMSRSYMSTNLLSFLLLHHFRRGVMLPVLLASFNKLIENLLKRNWEIGFSGDFTEVIFHAVNLFGCDLVEVTYMKSKGLMLKNNKEKFKLKKKFGSKFNEDASGDSYFNILDISKSDGSTNRSTKNKDFLIKPNLEPPFVFELAYYANSLVPVYAMESLAALSVGAVLKCKFSEIELEFACMEKEFEMQITTEQLPSAMLKSFSKQQLIDKILNLSNILRYDLILCDVTESLEVCATLAVEKLLQEDLLINNTIYQNRQYLNAYSNFCWEETKDSAEDCLQVNFNHIHDFVAKQSILGPFIEGYLVAALQLPSLLDTPLLETQLKSQVVKVALERVSNNLAIRPESASSDIIRRALYSFEENEIISRCVDNTQMLQLTEKYNDINVILDYISDISQYQM